MIAVFVLQSNETYASHIRFEQTKTYSEVSVKAQSENKSFFVYFSASWCGPCQIMNRTAFKDENLANFIDNHVIPVKVDIDQITGKLWQDQFNVKAIPTIIFFDNNGIEQSRVTSGLSGSKLLSILASMDPNHHPDNVTLPTSNFVAHNVNEIYNTSSSTTHSPLIYSNVSKSSFGKSANYEIELGNYNAESDIEFQINLLADRFKEHRFYIIQRQIPSGIIFQLILTGFKNENEALNASNYLQSRNLDPQLVRL